MNPEFLFQSLDPPDNSPEVSPTKNALPMLSLHKKSIEKFQRTASLNSIKPKNFYTLSDVQKHNKQDDCWVIINSKVYDVTNYLNLHPGGWNLIFRSAGGDCTVAFEGMFHSMRARRVLSELCIGDVVPEEVKAALEPEVKFYKCTLKNVLRVSHDTVILQFESESDHPIPLGAHIKFKFSHKGETILKPYTPIRQEGTSFDLLVKRYENGPCSQFLHHLKIKDVVSFSQPFGSFRSYRKMLKQNKYLHITMIAAGTGITPMFPLITYILNPNSKCPTRISLLWANKSENDICFKDVFENLQKTVTASRFLVYYLLSKPKSKEFSGFVGRITQSLVEKVIPADNSLTLICGPDGFVEEAKKILKVLNYSPKSWFVF